MTTTYGAYFARKLDRHLRDATRSPLGRIEDFVDDAREGMARHDFRRGCLVGNLGQEANVSIEHISVRAIPLVGSMVVIDLVLAFFPQISLWLPTLLGF